MIRKIKITRTQKRRREKNKNKLIYRKCTQLALFFCTQIKYIIIYWLYKFVWLIKRSKYIFKKMAFDLEEWNVPRDNLLRSCFLIAAFELLRSLYFSFSSVSVMISHVSDIKNLYNI